MSCISRDEAKWGKSTKWRAIFLITLRRDNAQGHRGYSNTEQITTVSGKSPGPVSSFVNVNHFARTVKEAINSGSLEAKRLILSGNLSPRFCPSCLVSHLHAFKNAGSFALSLVFKEQFWGRLRVI